MKKTKLLSLTALALIGILGLSSCSSQGPKGDKGDQGIQGETGPKGDKGDPGENGEDGEDGATWLTGTTKPADTLGKLGDMYLNTSNGDVYQKEADGWKLKMNIQGEDGEDGKDGHNGSNGSTGPKGDTAWSNTILPTTGGNIGVNLGSAVEGSEVIFTFEPDDNYSLAEVILNGEKITNIDAPVEGVYSYKTTMVKNGFVVAAKFEASDKVGKTSYFENGVLYTGGKVDAFGNVIEKGQAQTGDDSPKFSSGDGLTAESALVIDDINNIDSLGKESIAETGAKYFELAKGLSSNENKVTINTDTINNLFEGKTGQEKEVFLNLGENNVDLPNSGNAYAVSGGANVEISNGIIDNSLKTSNTTSADINVKDGSTLTLNNVELLSKGGLMAEGSASTLNILNSKVESSVYGFGTNAAVEGQNVEINIISSEISSNTDDGDNAGLYVNIPCNVYIEDTVISGDRQGMFVRQGNVTLKNVTIEYGENINNFASLVTKNNNYLNGDWGSGNEIPSAALVLGDRSNTVNYQEVDSTVNVDGLTIKNRDANESLSVLADEKNTETPTYYLYAYDNTPEKNSFTLNIDKESYDKIPSEKMFNKDVIINVEGVEATSTNTFVDGQLYSELYLKDDGSVDETLSTKVDGVKFAGGDGTAENPLQVDNLDQWKLINEVTKLTDTSKATAEYLTKESYSYKLNADLVLDSSLEWFTGSIDGNGHKISFADESKNSFILNNVYGDVEIKNLTIDLTNGKLGKLFNVAWNNSDDVYSFLENLTISNIDINGNGEPTIVNSNNFGFITPNALFNAHPSDEVFNILVEDVNINNFNIFNSGTCAGVFFGYSPYTPNYKTTIKNSSFTGTLGAMNQVGYLFSNASGVTSPNWNNIEDKSSYFTLENCSLNGSLNSMTDAYKGLVCGLDDNKVNADETSKAITNNIVSKNDLSDETGDVAVYYSTVDGKFYTSYSSDNGSRLNYGLSINNLTWPNGDDQSNGVRYYFDIETKLDLNTSSGDLVNVKDLKYETMKYDEFVVDHSDVQLTEIDKFNVFGTVSYAIVDNTLYLVLTPNDGYENIDIDGVGDKYLFTITDNLITGYKKL